MPPEPPQVRLGALFFGRRGNRHYTVLPRVQRCRHAADGAPLAGGVITFEHRHQGVPAHALVTQQAGQTGLFGDQLFLIVGLVQAQGHVQGAKQAAVVDAVAQRGHVALVLALGIIGQRGLQAFQQNAPHRQAAVIRVYPFDDVPWRIVAAGAAQHALTKAHEAVVGLRLLPIQRADLPAVQRVVLERFQPRLHLFLGQVEPELEDQRAFVTEHLFQARGAANGLFEYGILELAMHPALQHLAVPVAEKHANAPLGRQCAPVAPGRWPGKLLVGLLVEGAHFDQARVHPLVKQLYRLALAGAFNAVDQHNHRETRLLLEFELRLEQGLT
ncbi:hypothetical protein D9M71_279500 [compost metagenome]